MCPLQGINLHPLALFYVLKQAKPSSAAGRLRSPDMHLGYVRAPVSVYAFSVALGSSLSPQRFSALTQQN